MVDDEVDIIIIEVEQVDEADDDDDINEVDEVELLDNEIVELVRVVDDEGRLLLEVVIVDDNDVKVTLPEHLLGMLDDEVHIIELLPVEKTDVDDDEIEQIQLDELDANELLLSVIKPIEAIEFCQHQLDELNILVDYIQYIVLPILIEQIL